jgi:di/tricarboxylate transporter
MFKASLLAVVVLAVAGYLSTQLVQQSLELRVLLTIALSFALGSALESSGLARGFAEQLTILGSGNPWIALVVVHLATALLTELVTNNAAAALMVPIALAVSDSLGVSHFPFVVTTMVGASASFSTPIGYTTNLMVYAPGGYRFTDYLKIGLPMSLLVAVLNLSLCPIFFPF